MRYDIKKKTFSSKQRVARNLYEDYKIGSRLFLSSHDLKPREREKRRRGDMLGELDQSVDVFWLR